jgi:hypothetical protein
VRSINQEKPKFGTMVKELIAEGGDLTVGEMGTTPKSQVDKDGVPGGGQEHMKEENKDWTMGMQRGGYART